MASAQGWLADRKYAEGIGIKAGDFEIHPGLGGEAGFDSNWLLRTYNNGFVNGCPTACPDAAGIFRLTGSLYISTISAQRKEGDTGNAEPPTVNFRAGIDVTQRFFVGDQTILNQNGIDGLSGDANLRVDILPRRPFSAGLQAGYTRTVYGNTTGNPDANFNQNLLNFGADFTITPGSGTLDWKFGYLGNVDFFDESSTNAPFNNMVNSIFTRGQWKFTGTQKTALIYDGNFSFTNYFQQAQAFNALLNSTPIRSRLGISGLIGPRFGLTAFAGYGGSFVNTGGNAQVQQYDQPIGQLEAKFFLTPNPGAENPGAITLAISSLALGYSRDFMQSYLGTYYGSDRGYLKFAFFFGGRALVSLEGGFGAREYPRLFSNNGGALTQIAAPFVDGAADATLFGEYRVSNMFGLNTTLRYTEEVSSTVIAADTQGDKYHMAYRRFEAYLGFRWFM